MDSFCSLSFLFSLRFGECDTKQSQISLQRVLEAQIYFSNRFWIATHTIDVVSPANRLV